jgi:PTH2 family peptidyl-tRNA hydrolase
LSTVKGTKKIAVKVKGEAPLLALQAMAESTDVPNAVIEDAGLTQVDPGSRTVLGLGPAPSAILDQITGKLALL